MAYVRIKNLKKEYSVTREQKQQVLKGIEIEFQRGEFVAMLGESGCGKSTFLNIMAGLDFDYTGSIVIAGKFIRDYSEKELDIHRKNKVGIIFQSFNLIKQMTAFENVMMPLTLTTLSHEERKARAEELLEQVGLKDHMMKKPNQLSGGQKQRVAIARALANNPTILLADEPTGNLDATAGQEIMEILQGIAQSGKLVICVTHSEKMASYCTRVVRMEDGLISKDTKEKGNYKEAKEEEKPTPVKDNIDKKEILKFAKNNLFTSLKRNILVSVALSIGICAFVLMFFLSTGMKAYVENDLSTGMNKFQINVYKESSAVGTFTSGNLDELNLYFSGTSYAGALINNAKVSYEADTILTTSTYYDGWTAKKLWGETNAKKVEQDNPSTNNIIISSSMMQRLAYQWYSSKISNDEEITWDDFKDRTVSLSYDGKTSVTYNIRGVIDDSDGYDHAYISTYGMVKLQEGNPSATRDLNNSEMNLIYFVANKVSAVSGIIEDIEDYFGWYAYQPDSFAADILSYVDLYSLILTVVSAIALVVSAIMIFIVMYISVIERTKEIGILRALGTRRRDVKRIFITEAGIIGCVAGVAGCLLAVVIGLFTNLGAGSWIISINPLYMILGLTTSFLVSVLSSLGPSSSGSSMDPIEALRLND